MDETYLSFYLKVNRIHVFTDTLRRIGRPSRICFLIGENGRALVMTPYSKRDFRSHNVPGNVYDGHTSLEISSMKLCRMIAQIHHWDVDRSYRIPGRIFPEEKIVLYHLDSAVIIDRQT